MTKRSMKDSGIEWIGEIPEKWISNRIKNDFYVFSGATPKSDNPEYWDGDIRWITPADFKTEDVYVKKGSRNISIEGYNSCGTTIVPSGSIIFSKRAPIGTVGISNSELCTNQGCLSCIPKGQVYSKFYYYLFSVLTEQFNLYGTGTTFKEISFDNFVNFKIITPSEEEQVRIADFLDKKVSEIDAVISKTKESIEEYKKLKQSIITEAITKGLNPNIELKDSGVEWIGYIPNDWEIKPFYSLLDNCENNIVDGPFGSDMKNEEYVDEGVPVIQIGSVKEKGLDFSKIHFITNEKADSLSRHNAQPYDMAITKMMPAGKACEIPNTYNRYVVSADVMRARISDKELRRFLIYVFNAYVTVQANIESHGSTRSRINISKVKKTSIAIPSRSEMKEIVSFLNKECSKLDTTIIKKEQIVTELEQYKKSLIYEYVTGKKEV